MDIGGSELAAIAIASDTIRRYRPQLAIAAYHLLSDFWKIPEAVLSIYPKYSLQLRHYTEGIFETVIYFIPDNG